MSSITYIQAVRLHRPVRELEELRQLVCGAYNRDEFSMMAFAVHFNHADALRFAVMYGHRDYVEYLLKSRPREALTEQSCCPILFMAIYSGFTEIVDLICSHSKTAGIQKGGRYYIDFSGCMALENGKIPLQIAAELGAHNIVRILLRHGADLMALDRGQNVFRDALSIEGHIQGRFDHGDDGLGVWLSLRLMASVLSNFTIKMQEDYRAAAQVNNVEVGLQFPVSLSHQCRAVIRRHLGPDRLPVRNSGLPRLLERYINLE